MITSQFGHWFAGLVDGEGSFGMSLGGRPRFIPECQFQLALRDDDRAILDEIQDTLGFGKVYARKPMKNIQGYMSKPMACFMCSNKPETMELVRLIRKFPLHTKKAEVFEAWARAVEIWCSREWRGRMTEEKIQASEEMRQIMEELKSLRGYSG